MSAQDNAQQAAGVGKDEPPANTSTATSTSAASAVPDLDTPPLPGGGSTTTAASKNKKKKKKNKKQSAGVSSAVEASTSSARDTTSPGGLDSATSLRQESAADDETSASSALPTPLEQEIDVAMATAGTAMLPSELPPARDADELPNLGDHVQVPGIAMGVPASMPPQASKLFADDAEEVAFLDDTSPVDDVAKPRSRAQEEAEVAAFTAKTALPADQLSTAPDANQLPNFGDHVSSGHAVESKMGVPAPMPLQGSALFADQGEQDAFLDNTEPKDGVFNVVVPSVVKEARTVEAAKDASGEARTPSADKLPSGVSTFVADDFEEAAFESEADVDEAVTKAGQEHARLAGKGAETETTSTPKQPPYVAPTSVDDPVAEAAFEGESDVDDAVTAAGRSHSIAAKGEKEHATSRDERTTLPTQDSAPSADKAGATATPSHDAATSTAGALAAGAVAAGAITTAMSATGKAKTSTAAVNDELSKSSSAKALFEGDSSSAALDIDQSEPVATQAEPAADDKGGETREPASTKAATDVKEGSSAQSLFGDDAPDFHIGGSASGGSLSTSPHTRTADEAAAPATAGAASLFGDDGDAELDLGHSDPLDSEPIEKVDNTNLSGRDAASSGVADKLFQDQATDATTGNDSIQSIFGAPDTTNDWLVDTSVDDSLHLGRNDMPAETPEGGSNSTDDVDSQVPQGWYDDAGEWNWYTEEEREQVRLAMFGDRDHTDDVAAVASQPEAQTNDPYAPSGYSSTQASTSAYAPAAAPFTSAAAPYTPAAAPYAPAAAPYAPAAAPYAPAAAPYASSAAPYAPAAVATSAYAPSAPAPIPSASYFPPTPASGGLFTPGMPQASAYTPTGYGAGAPHTPSVSTPAPYGAQPSAYDPYAPSSQPAATPYAASHSSAAPASAPAPAKQPEPPKRMKSTAYDPPFIKPKSTVRPASVTPVAGIQAFSPPPSAAAPKAAPAAPPPGPPKRSKTHEAAPAPEPLRSSSTASASSPALDRSKPESGHGDVPHTATKDLTHPDTSYVASQPEASEHAAAPAVDPYAPAPPSPMDPYNLPPLYKGEAPVQPPKRPSTASSSQPPKPTSFDPPLRSTSSRPPSRHAQRPHFAAPPAPGSGGSNDSASAIPPVPPIPTALAPPKAPSRHASPVPHFEPPPVPALPPSRGPSRGPASATPAFEAPPVAAPPPPPGGSRSTASHQPPPRVASPHAAPPRVTSPLRHEMTPPRIRQALSLHEEFDPEGGTGEVWDEDSTDISVVPPQHSTPPAASHTYEEDAEDDQETPKSEEPSPVHVPRPLHEALEQPHAAADRQYQPVSSQYDSSAAYGESAARKSSTTAEYDPYAAGSHSQYTRTPSAPYEPSSDYSSQAYNRKGSAAPEQDPYAPSSSSQQTAKQASSDPYNPYGPSTSPKTTTHQQLSEPYNPYAAAGRSSGEYHSSGQAYGQVPQASASSNHTRQGSVPSVYNPYAPSGSPEQTYSPYAPGPATNPYESQADSYNPYAAPTTTSHAVTSPLNQQRSLPAQAPYDPYAPTSISKHKSTSSSTGVDAYGGAVMSPPPPSFFQSTGPADSTYVPQQVLEQRPVSEDPLGRCNPSARDIPLAVFGFGGVLITSFPGAAQDTPDAPSYGYASHRGLITIRPIADVVESSALGTSSVAFPGPLVFDPAVAKGAAGEKKRREGVLAYLSARADEIERGLPYLKSSASTARREEEAKLVIVRILTALIEGDGKLFGTPKSEEALKAALQLPATPTTPSSSSLGMKCPAKCVCATPVQLSHLSALLLRGDKKDAAHFAAEAGLWSHALVISSAVGPDLWREIVTRFTTAELGREPSNAGLTAAYSVFSGLQPSTVDDLMKAANITSDPSADHWREVVAAVLFNGKPTDLICLDDLGNRLDRAGLKNAAQVCYLLSPNSPFSDMSPTAGDRPIKLAENAGDEDGAIFAEIAEYARSLVPTPKGIEAPHAALPQLFSYKMERAWHAADLGEVEQAKRYCNAIEAACKPTKNARSRLPRHVAASMEDLMERLTGEPSIDPSSGIGTRKGKSGASLGSWIEGRLTKFIAGEDEEGAPKPAPKETKGAPVGPFSHFSTISPGPSTSVSRAASSVDVNDHPANFTSTETYGGYTPDNSYAPWGENEDSETPPAVPSVNVDDGEAEFINPMANVSFGATPVATTNDYAPPAAVSRVLDEEDDDDLGFGNSSLSRSRTPKVDSDDKGGKSKAAEAPKKEESKPAAKAEPEHPAKSGWFGGWFGKKGESSGGPIRAKLGEESSMVYDENLKRWVTKGTKSAPAAAAAPPPPPRGKTASPAQKEPSHQPQRPATGTPPVPPMPSGSARNSLGGSSNGPPTGPPSGPPTGPPSTAPSRVPTAKPTSSIDDLLSRPSSGRPASAAAKSKKRAGNKYVVV